MLTRTLTVFSASIALLLLPDLAAGEAAAGRIDRRWYAQSLTEETTRWRHAALRPNGFFAVAMDREWKPAATQRATLVSQSRQIFVMTAGYDHTGDPVFLEAVRLGADFLLRHFRDPEHGLFFYSVTPEGEVKEDRKDSYGLAFAIFALSHAGRVTKEDRYTRAALETWAEMKRRLRDETGFFRNGMDRAYTRTIGRNWQNCMMHLFEALLELHETTGSKAVLEDARQLADLIFTRLYDARLGRLPELFDEDWNPAPPETKGYIELGHQFEWAFLLSRAVEKGLPKRYIAIGERLLDYGMKTAIDEKEGGIHSRLDPEGNVIQGAMSWWEQCEALRAMLHWAALRGRKDLWPAYEKTLSFVRKRFIDAEHGGWYGFYDPALAVQRTNKGTVWQAGYHVCSLYREALRLTAPSRQ